MPFYIPKYCDHKFAWEIALGKGPPTMQEGWWPSLRRKVSAFFAFSWKLKAEDISRILGDSTKRDAAIKTMIVNPRWLRSDLSLATSVYEKLGSGEEKEKLENWIIRNIESIARKRLWNKGGLGDQFLMSARKGDIDLMRLLLIVDPNLVIHSDWDGNTALIWAARNRHGDIVRLLLDNGADVNKTNNDNKTALFEAARYGHADCVGLLLSVGDIDVDHVNNAGDTTLIWTAHCGHADIVRLLLENGAAVNHVNNAGNTALIEAAYWRHTDIVRLLLENEAAVNHVNNAGNTALHRAALRGGAAIIRILLENGADFNCVDAYGRTPIYLSRPETRRVFLDFFCEENILDKIRDWLKFLTQKQILEKLLTTDLFSGMETKDAEPFLGTTGAQFVASIDGNNLDELKKWKNGRDRFGNTPLIYAAAKNRMGVVEVLLQEGADLHSRNIAGDSAVDTAAKMGHMEICLRLLEECHQRAPYVQAAILAASNGHADLLGQLLSAYPWLLTAAPELRSR